MNKKHLLLVIISTFCQFSLAQQNTSSIPSVGSFFTEVGKNANVVSPIYDMEGKKAIDMDLLGQQDKTYHDGIMTLTGKSNNRFYHEGWININGNAYLTVPGTNIKARLKGASGVSTSPGRTNITYSEVRNFTLTFESLPESTTTFNFYESPSSRWKIEGVRVK